MSGTIQMMASEPGFWIIVGLPMFALINLMAALRQRTYSKRFYAELENLVRGRKLNAHDKALLSNMLPDKSPLVSIIASIFAPVALIGSVAVSLAQTWSRGEQERGSLMKPLGEVDSLIAKMVEMQSGLDPKKSALWGEPRRNHLYDLAHSIEFLESPLSAAWLGVWLIVALPGIALIYMLSGTTHYFVQNIMQPLQVSIALSLKSLKLST